MFNPINFISKFIKSSNQKELDRLIKIVSKVNENESRFEKLKNEDFPIKTKASRELLLETSICLQVSIASLNCL